jgi:hypothetical protein
MKYSILPLATLLFASSLSSVLGDSVLLDPKILMKVPGGPVPEDLNLATKDTKTPEKFKTALAALRRAVVAGKSAAKTALETESHAVSDIMSSFPNDGTLDGPNGAAHAVIEEENMDWELRLKAFDSYPTTTTIHNYANMKQAVEAAKSNVDSQYNLVVSKCGQGSAMRRCLTTKFIKEVKMALMSLQLFLGANLNNTRAATGLNPSEFFRPELKFLLDQINTPSGRFSISPIAQDMSFNQVYKQSQKDLATSIRDMKLKLRQLTARVKESKDSALIADMALRKRVVDAMLARPEDQDRRLSKELVDSRVAGFKRLAQGQVRTLQEGTSPATSDQVTLYVKMWQMAEQMFTKDGWKDENRRYGLLQVPSSVQLTLEASEATTSPSSPSNPTPSEETHVNKLEPKLVRSESASTVASTDSNVSVSNNKTAAPPATPEKPSGFFGGLTKSLFGA